MGSAQTARIAASVFVVAASLGLAASPHPQDDTAKLAKIAEQFSAVKANMGEFPSACNASVVASVIEERLKKRKTEEHGGRDWRCESAMRTAVDDSYQKRQALQKIVRSMENSWNAAKGTAKGMDASMLPWGESRADVDKAVRAASSLLDRVTSAKTADGPKSASALWSKAQEFEKALPKCLPAAKATAIVPASVAVPCINETVTLRSGG